MTNFFKQINNQQICNYLLQIKSSLMVKFMKIYELKKMYRVKRASNFRGRDTVIHNFT